MSAVTQDSHGGSYTGGQKGAATLFSAAIQNPTPLRSNAAAELMRRLVTSTIKPQPAPMPSRLDELPADLDQRVRLVGEW